MTTLTEESKAIFEQLLESNEDQLYVQLGAILKATGKDLKADGDFLRIQTSFIQAQMLDMRIMQMQVEPIIDDLKKLGHRLFRRWHIEFFKLICGVDPDDKKDREDLARQFGVDQVSLAAIIAAFLVSHFGLLPALAAIIAAILVKRFFKPTHQEFCAVWQEHLPSSG